MKLISACLLGENCKYNGGNNLREDMLVLEKVIPVCAEVMGGMPTPRMPSEIEENYSGEDVICGKAIVINSAGEDVTKYFVSGAEMVLKIAKENNVTTAYLKQSSPSCGCGKIYDGTFSGTKKCGNGVLAALLKMNGIEVIGIE